MARDPKQPRPRGGMSDAAKYVSMAMLAIIALAVLSLILMFCGVAAVSAIDDFDGARSNLVAFTWALLLFYAILLVLILLVVLMGWKRPKMARRLHLSLIVFLAIMIAWLGTQADKATAAERSVRALCLRPVFCASLCHKLCALRDLRSARPHAARPPCSSRARPTRARASGRRVSSCAPSPPASSSSASSPSRP